MQLVVPEGARRATIDVVALRKGWWPLRQDLRASVRALDASARAVSERADTLRAARAVGAEWTRLELDIPAGTARLALDAAEEPGVQVWWSDPLWHGVAPAGARNVLLVSLDTVRADAVSCSGQALPTTPSLDALAAEATLFTRASAPSSWTLPSHVSVMTGVLPSWHGHARLERRAASPRPPTLARLLGAAGWETAAFTGEGSISWLMGPTRDFGLVQELPPTPRRRWAHPFTRPECDRGVEAAIAWLRERTAARSGIPFFLFWHTYEPHWPYTDGRFVGRGAPLPRGVGEDAREDWERYLGDVAAADAALGRLLATLADLGLRDTTDLVVLSDHGEELGEHSGGRRGTALQHGHGSWESLLHVPLVARVDGVATGRRDDLVSLVDVFPTLLLAAGLPAPVTHGRPLQEPGGHARVAAEALCPQHVEFEEKAWRTDDDLKYVLRLAAPAAETLWSLDHDPGETRDLAAARPGDVARLRAELLELLAGAPPDLAVRAPAGAADGEALPAGLRESLEALGYVR